MGWIVILGWGGALVMLFLFAALTEEVLEGEFVVFNHAILHVLHALSAPWLDRLALGLSALGGIVGTLVVSSLVLVLLLVMRRTIDALAFLILLAGGSALTVVLKHVFRQPRPALFESLAPETSFSFPSGHSLISVCLYGYLGMLLALGRPPWGGLAALGLWLVPMAIMWSRLYLGVHWLTDVVAGALVANFWLLVCLLLRRSALRRRPR